MFYFFLQGAGRSPGTKDGTHDVVLIRQALVLLSYVFSPRTNFYCFCNQEVKVSNSCFRMENFLSLHAQSTRSIPLPCVFLWVRRGVPGLDFIFSKFYYGRVPATVFHPTFTLYFLVRGKGIIKYT